MSKLWTPKALIIIAGVVFGALAALMSSVGLDLTGIARRRPAAAEEPSAVPFVAAVLLLPVLAFFLVRYLSLRSRLQGKAAAATSRSVGRVVGEGTADEEPEPRFSGPPANEAIVRGYVSWRTQLAAAGILFRRDRTAEESEAYLQTRLPATDTGTLRRSTELFSTARYGRRGMAAGELEEFKELTRGVLETVKPGR